MWGSRGPRFNGTWYSCETVMCPDHMRNEMILGRDVLEKLRYLSIDFHSKAVGIGRGTIKQTTKPRLLWPNHCQCYNCQPGPHATGTQDNPALTRLVDTARITGNHKAELHKLLVEFQDVVLWEGELGRTSVTKHEMDTASAQPVRSAARRTGFHEKAEIDRIIKKCWRMISSKKAQVLGQAQFFWQQRETDLPDSLSTIGGSTRWLKIWLTYSQELVMHLTA